MVFPNIIFKIERWKFNKEYGVYVSTEGHFKNRYKQRIPVAIDGSGYCAIKTENGIKRAHRLVMLTWRPIPDAESLTVDHLDHNKRNNMLNNLEWVSKAENLRRAKNDLLVGQKEEKKPQVYRMEEFYPCVDGFAFDNILTAWWYCQEKLDKDTRKKECTLEGLSKKFTTLLNCYNNGDQNTFRNYCTLRLTLARKE